MPQAKPQQSVISKTDWQKLPEHLREYFQEVEQDDRPTRPCVVCDVFMGAGTTAMVAIQNGRNYAGIELSQEYIAIAETRIAAVNTGVTVKEAHNGQGALWK